ncbi:MAG: methyltransferase domain-containing protein [Alistipes sp.]
MLTPETYALLCTSEIQQAIAENRDRDPLKVALDRRVPQAALVATQVKYLTRAASKLPSYRAAQCILPSLAFEQASSEECAAHKRIEGDVVLDLTCGLGVDTCALAHRFSRVVSLERNPLLALITRDNLRRMGIANVEVVCAAAEEYLTTTTERFDWIYADPDRRSAIGRKLVRLEDCSPNIPALMPSIRRVSGRLCLKNSPLFDVDEAFAIFGGCEVEVVSLGGECKEVLVYADGSQARITATALGLGSFTALRTERTNSPCTESFDPARYGWLITPDVALQKARVACMALRDVAHLWSNEGYGFAEEEPHDVMGKVGVIERIEPYDPKALRRELRGERVELLKRDFPLTAAQIAAQIGVREGGAMRLAFTKIGGNFWTIRIK